MFSKQAKITQAIVALIALTPACTESSKFAANPKAKGTDPQAQFAVPACKNPRVETNILLMFDSSESQIISDPSNVRASGATGFLDNLVEMTANETTSTKKYLIAVANFADSAISGAGGWQVANSQNRSTIASDIQAATEKPIGFTNYHAALTLSYEIFRELSGKDQKDVTARNFLVFLTDGEPTIPQPDPRSDIESDIDRLVSGLQVSVMTVAAGNGVKPAGVELLRTMARAPSGAGEFFEAKTADDLRQVWRNIEAKITGDCSVSPSAASEKP